MLRLAVTLALIAVLSACGREAADELMADQVARLNREVARLHERLDALEKRLDDGASRTAGAGPNEASSVNPVVADPTASKTPALLTVIIDDRIRVDGVALAEDALAERLRSHAQAAPETQLVIRVGAEIPHARVTAVLDLARGNGIQAIAIAPAAPDAP